MTKKEKRELKKKVRLAEQMLENAKRKRTSHVVTVVRQTVPCWERMSSEDE
tara:strand:+ start:652 stop:804 length:153 start_codon:yes stop_codon:yes gene_type:complete